jgi:hypothetical protein
MNIKIDTYSMGLFSFATNNVIMIGEEKQI